MDRSKICGLTITGERALDFHVGVITELRLPLPLSHSGDDRLHIGGMIWIREPWRTFISLDQTADHEIWHAQARRGAGIAYDAGGRGLSIARRIGEDRGFPEYFYGDRDELAPFGRLRPAAVMPIWASRSCGVVKSFCRRRVAPDVLALDALPLDADAWAENPIAAIFQIEPIAQNINDYLASDLVRA